MRGRENRPLTSQDLPSTTPLLREVTQGDTPSCLIGPGLCRIVDMDFREYPSSKQIGEKTGSFADDPVECGVAREGHLSSQLLKLRRAHGLLEMLG